VATTLLQLLIFFLPFQFGKHFWPSWSHLAGLKIDYLSPAIYSTDMLLMAYLILNIRTTIRIYHKYTLGVYICILFATLNCMIAIHPPLAAYWWLRQFLYLLFTLVLSSQKNIRSIISRPLSLSIYLIVFLALLQLIGQHSVNMIFYYFGERTFDFSTYNLAKIGHLIRPYSTFSHPNSFAAYLLLCYFIFQKKLNNKYALIACLGGMLIALSKGVLLALFIGIVLNYLIKHKPRYFKLACGSLTILSLIISIAPLLPHLSRYTNSITTLSSRLYFGQIGIPLFTHINILGVGLGNYLPAIVSTLSPSQISIFSLQPIHSVFLLSIAEIGLLATFLALIFVFKNLYYSSNYYLLIITTLVLLTGCIDHYWWTLPQNHLILALAVALGINNK